MRVNMGPDTRLSRPTTMVRTPERDAQAPNAAAYVATISGVNASPTRPRTPDTLTINPSNPMPLLVDAVLPAVHLPVIIRSSYAITCAARTHEPLA